MTDTPLKEDSYMFKLATDNGLSPFKYVMFVSSNQDNYVPTDSARVQVCARAAEEDRQKAGGGLYLIMAESIMSTLTSC